MAGSISTTALIAAGTSVAGAGIGAYGAIQQANAASSADKYQQQMALGNQKIADQNAAFAGAQGEAAAAQKEQQTRAQMGLIESAQGSSGIDINGGSSTDVRTSQAELGQLDAQTIRSNAALKAYGFETQSTNFGNEASADASQAKNAKAAGYFNAGSGILSGIGSAAFNYSGIMGKSSGLLGSSKNPASSNAEAAASYTAIDNNGAGSY